MKQNGTSTCIFYTNTTSKRALFCCLKHTKYRMWTRYYHLQSIVVTQQYADNDHCCLTCVIERDTLLHLQKSYRGSITLLDTFLYNINALKFFPFYVSNNFLLCIVSLAASIFYLSIITYTHLSTSFTAVEVLYTAVEVLFERLR
jgi:hypothetical protein